MSECECSLIAGYHLDGLCSSCVNIWLKSAIQKEKDRAVKIVKSHIETMYPINCRGIIAEIQEPKK